MVKKAKKSSTRKPRKKSVKKTVPEIIEIPETLQPEIIPIGNSGFFSKFFRVRFKPNLCPAFLDDITIQTLIAIPLLIMMGVIVWWFFGQ
jgi:hypothetical protein